MKPSRTFFFLLLLLVLDADVTAAQESEELPTLAFEGAQWFDGEGFHPATFYSVDGELTSQRPSTVDRTLDLSGTFLVPPYGDAHIHGFESSRYLEYTIASYLRQGVFYARNPNNCLSGREAAADSVNQPWSVDVAYANGGITAPGAHPVFTYEALALGYRPYQVRDRAEEIRANRTEAGNCYFVAAGRQDLHEAWPQILEGEPDFIKVYLNGSEHYAERQRQGKQPKGLDPDLLPLIVEKADSSGLRTIAHIETAHDFRVALDAGVDEVAHMAGYAVNTEDPDLTETDYTVDAQTLREAGTKGMVVNPTFYRAIQMIRYIAEDSRPDSATVAQIRRFHRDVLRELRDQDVPIVIGGDSPGLSPLDEAMYYHELGTVDNAAVLRMLSVVTPRRIFPDREIGCLDDGCEASFLALEGNPLDDISHLRRIAVRLKEGRLLTVDEE